jgi:hypothetical protein
VTRSWFLGHTSPCFCSPATREHETDTGQTHQNDAEPEHGRSAHTKTVNAASRSKGLNREKTRSHVDEQTRKQQATTPMRDERRGAVDGGITTPKLGRKDQQNAGAKSATLQRHGRHRTHREKPNQAARGHTTGTGLRPADKSNSATRDEGFDESRQPSHAQGSNRTPTNAFEKRGRTW